MPSDKAAPVIDFSQFLSGEPAKVKQCAEEIRSAAQKEGFFQIINHPITRKFIGRGLPRLKGNVD